MSKNEKFVFQINEESDLHVNDNTNIEFVKYMLTELLEHIDCTYKGKKIKVDGFKFIDESLKEVYKLY